MADFRKLFFVFVVMAVAAATAFGQVTCTSSAVSINMRSGGITEKTGDLVLTCSSTADVTGSFTVLASNAIGITNTVGAAQGLGLPLTGAVLSVNGVATSLGGFLQSNTTNSVVFPTVAIPTGSSTVRISGIRVAVNVVTTPSPVYENISVTGVAGATISVTNPFQQVGIVYPSLGFTVTSCSGGAVSSQSFQQCVSQPTGAKGDMNFAVQFDEGQNVAAFKNATEEGADAGTGTRLIVNFSNVPSGVTVFVTDLNILSSKNVTATSVAQFVEKANADGTGGTVGTVKAGTAATCPISGSNAVGAATLVPAIAGANGSAYAVYEIKVDDQSTRDVLAFGVQLAYTANPGAGVPALTGAAPVTVTGDLAPQSTNTTALPAPSSGAVLIPRFQTPAVTGNVSVTIAPCVTNLLFPYVTNAQGWDTGIAVSNTSKDPNGTFSQTGDCVVSFFGNATVAPQTISAVAPGTVGTIDVNTAAAGATFSGYAVAKCAFQYGHGISVLVAPGVSGSQNPTMFPALVIPDRSDKTRPSDPFTTGGAGSGEQLGF